MFLPTHASWYCFHRVAYLCLYRCLSLCISTKQKVVLVQTYLVVWNNIWLLRVFGRVCSFVCSAESAKCRDLWLVWYFVLFCSFLITVFLCLCFYAFVLCISCFTDNIVTIISYHGRPARWITPFWQPPPILYIYIHMYIFLMANKLCCC